MAAALLPGEEAAWRGGSIYVAQPASTKEASRRMVELLDVARQALPEWPMNGEILRTGAQPERFAEDNNGF